MKDQGRTLLCLVREERGEKAGKGQFASSGG